MATSAEYLVGKTVYDYEHNKVGKIHELYIDDNTRMPTWIAVSTGFMGGGDALVPLAIAHFDSQNENIIVEAAKDAIRESPRIRGHEELSPQDQEVLFKYYRAVVDNPTEKQDELRDARDDNAEEDDRNSAIDNPLSGDHNDENTMPDPDK